MTALPSDLIPLHKVAKAVHQVTDKLAKLSAKGEFPTVYRFGDSRCSRWVSESAAAQWLETRTEEVLQAEEKALADLAMHISRGASRERLSPQSLGDSSASPSRGCDAG